MYSMLALNAFRLLSASKQFIVNQGAILAGLSVRTNYDPVFEYLEQFSCLLFRASSFCHCCWNLNIWGWFLWKPISCHYASSVCAWGNKKTSIRLCIYLFIYGDSEGVPSISAVISPFTYCILTVASANIVLSFIISMHEWVFCKQGTFGKINNKFS